MPVFSNIVASLSPDLFASSSVRDAEALLSHLSGSCFVQCSVRTDGCYEIEGSWAAIQDVYIALCANTSQTVELVQSLVQAAKYVSVVPPKEKSQSIATQTDTPEPAPSDSEKAQAVTTVDKSTETVEEFSMPTAVPKGDDGNELVKVKKETVCDEKEEWEPVAEDEEEEEIYEGTRGKTRKRTMVSRHGKKKKLGVKPKVKIPVKKTSNRKGVHKAKKRKSVLATAGQISEAEIEATLEAVASEEVKDENDSDLVVPAGLDNIELQETLTKKRKRGTKYRSFQPEFSESPKKFIYMPDQLDNPEVQDLDILEQTVSGTGASNETVDLTEKRSPVKLREYSAEDRELDKIRENELMTECLQLAKDSIIKCRLCTYQVDNKDSFREHLRRRHLDKRHVCEICGAAFGMHNDLLKHKRRSHIHKHYCGICGKVYRTVRLVKEHVLTHIGINQPPKLFICQECGKTYQSSTGLNNHQKIEHSGMERPFVCVTCGQRFWQKCHLKEHEVNHTGKRPYMCAECGETFVYRTCLREHKKRHSNVRDYACDTCGKAFKVMAGLRGHMKRHDESQYLSCDVCNKRFATKSALERHGRTHTGEKPFACDECGQCFNDSSILRRHRLAKHPGCDPNYHSLRRRTGAGSHGVFKHHPPGSSIPVGVHGNSQLQQQPQQQQPLHSNSFKFSQSIQPPDVVTNYSTPVKVDFKVSDSTAGSTSEPHGSTGEPSFAMEEYTRQQIQTAASQIMTNILHRVTDHEAQQPPFEILFGKGSQTN